MIAIDEIDEQVNIQLSRAQRERLAVYERWLRVLEDANVPTQEARGIVASVARERAAA
jgi:hypothetical protein